MVWKYLWLTYKYKSVLVCVDVVVVVVVVVVCKLNTMVRGAFIALYLPCIIPS